MRDRNRKSEIRNRKKTAEKACSDFRLLISVFCLLTSACGFHPVYSKDYQQSLAVNLSQVAIVTDSSRVGQLLKAEISDQVNPSRAYDPVQYRMHIRLTELDIPLFINRDGTSGRGDLRYSSVYDLTRLADGKLVAHGTIERVASYNSSQNADYASFVSLEDARIRAVTELAQDYKLRLANLLPTLNDPAAVEVKRPSEAPPSLIPRPNDIHETRTKGF